MTDGNAAARPSCLPITSVTPSPLPPLLGGDTERRMVNSPLSEPGVALHDRHREAFIDGFLLSTPHPARRATFPASRRRGETPPGLTRVRPGGRDDDPVQHATVRTAFPAPRRRCANARVWAGAGARPARLGSPRQAALAAGLRRPRRRRRRRILF